MRWAALGDSALVITLGESVDPAVALRVQAVARAIERQRVGGVTDVVPAFASVAVFFDAPHRPNRASLMADLEAIVAQTANEAPAEGGRTVEIPVCYEGDLAPDLAAVAAHTKLSPEEVVRLHVGGEYRVHAIGFAPGFPYLGGLPASLATPRRATPRPSVPAGSVGIGGSQTGVYPLTTPGGWNIVGRTPRALFDAARVEPALLRSGDRVKFRAMTPAEFAREAEQEKRRKDPAPERPNAQPAAGRAALEILRPGLYTTVQDAGRRGHRAQGVPLSGGADAFALRLANDLVGNAEDAAVLELTLVGPEIRFLREVVVALCGADFPAMPRWRPVKLAAGTRLDFGVARSGCRGYLAVAGGIEVPPVLGSRSTYVRAKLGGVEGRCLRSGDTLAAPDTARATGDRWRIDERILPRYASDVVVRVVTGAQAGEFDRAWLEGKFSVSSRSDRMGVRLTGNPVARAVSRELISSPVVPGTIQVPPDGQPIVLLADGQTIGGYPHLAHVISVDLPLLAQLRPGDTVHFEAVSLDRADELWAAQEHALAFLREGLAQKLA